MALATVRPQLTPSPGDPDVVPFPTTVLIADDDTSVRRLLRLAFELDGYRTITAADGDRMAAFECGVDDYLEKPVKVSDLVERVRLRMGRTRRHRPVRLAVGVASSPGSGGTPPTG